MRWPVLVDHNSAASGPVQRTIRLYPDGTCRALLIKEPNTIIKLSFRSGKCFTKKFNLFFYGSFKKLTMLSQPEASLF